jgi:uncharacterized protein YjbI with pentapeptide repeats
VNAPANQARQGNLFSTVEEKVLGVFCSLPNQYPLHVLPDNFEFGKSLKVKNPEGPDFFDWTGANLWRADLTNVNLVSANLANANLENADLTNVNLLRANLAHANLENANVENVNLVRANLANANLKYSRLNKASLANANLTNANLTMSFIEDTDFGRANTFKADFSNTHGLPRNLTVQQIERTLHPKSLGARIKQKVSKRIEEQQKYLATLSIY